MPEQYRPELVRESDRYRGRRRVARPSRSRYAAVVTTAFVGAGIVAFGAGAGISDAKTDALIGDAAALSAADVAGRGDAADRASRGEDRTLSTSISSAPNAWVLPAHDFRLTSRYGQRWGKLHKGVDVALNEGVPFATLHAGTVVLSGWNGGYGKCVIVDHGNGVRTVYGHASSLLVKVGDKVQAGDIIALTGSTGHSFGPHLHLEVHVNDVAVDPIPWLKKRGLDLELEIEAAFDGSIS
ncbi:M23 family metallopeptidase [Catellatospora sp. NPDC049609]|uniref:M23 family metallopeptidase n=1 Tax=Catellatospora sp. NPDC049609 TaxID=3155505 RepID=UPI00344215B2